VLSYPQSQSGDSFPFKSALISLPSANFLQLVTH